MVDAIDFICAYSRCASSRLSATPAHPRRSASAEMFCTAASAAADVARPTLALAHCFSAATAASSAASAGAARRPTYAAASAARDVWRSEAAGAPPPASDCATTSTRWSYAQLPSGPSRIKWAFADSKSVTDSVRAAVSIAATSGWSSSFVATDSDSIAG